MARATLFEELLQLYTYSNPDGIAQKGDRIMLDLGAAVLGELTLTDRIRIELAEPGSSTGRYHPTKDALSIIDASPLGDPETDIVLQQLPRHSNRSPSQWVYNVASALLRPGDDATLSQRLVTRLTNEGILRTHQRKVLGLFPTHRYTLTDSSAAVDARGRLDQALHNAVPDARTATLALLLLAPSSHLASVGFPGAPNRETKALWHKLNHDDWSSADQCETMRALVAGLQSWRRGGAIG